MGPVIRSNSPYSTWKALFLETVQLPLEFQLIDWFPYTSTNARVSVTVVFL